MNYTQPRKLKNLILPRITRNSKKLAFQIQSVIRSRTKASFCITIIILTICAWPTPIPFDASKSELVWSYRSSTWLKSSFPLSRNKVSFFHSHTKLLRIIFIVRPSIFKTGKRSANISVIQECLNILSDTNFGDVAVNLEVLVVTKAFPSSIRTTWSAHNLQLNLQWLLGDFNVREASSSGNIDFVLEIWESRLGETAKDGVVIIDTGHTHIQNLSQNWYQFISSAHQRYSNRYDIFAYSPSMPENLSNISKMSKQRRGVESETFLWKAVPDCVILVLYSPSMWRAYLKWLQRHIGDWYIWPTMVDARSRSDERWASFNSTINAPWQLWLSRFLISYKVSILYPLKADKLLKKKSSNIDSRNFEIASVPINGDDESAGKKSRISRETLNAILELSKRHNDTISFTMVNENFISTALSWVCNVDVGGFRPPGIVWIATDDVAYKAMRKVPDSHAIRATELEGAKNGTDFGTPGYWLLMLERTFLIRDSIALGITVFLFETDQVWLRDPIPYVRRIMESVSEIDLIGSLDAGKEIGGNFLFIKPTLPMRKIYFEICERFEEAYRSAIVTGQLALVPNDQSILTRLVLYEEPFRSRYPVLFRPLDTERFVCGRWYKGIRSIYNTSKSRSPIIINNNWVKGVKAKTLRLKAFGHWFLTEDDKCDPSCVKKAIVENEKREANVRVNSGLGEKKELNVKKLVGEDMDANFEQFVAAIKQDRFTKF